MSGRLAGGLPEPVGVAVDLTLKGKAEPQRAYRVRFDALPAGVTAAHAVHPRRVRSGGAPAAASDDARRCRRHPRLPIREDVCRYLDFEPRNARRGRRQNPRSTRRRSRSPARTTFWQLAIEQRTSRAPRVIGDVYFAIKSVANSNGEIGWTSTRASTGRGYMTEAARAVLGSRSTRSACTGWSRGRLAQRRVGRAVQAPGHARGGALSSRHVVQGEWGDTSIYALLERDWRR